MDFTEKHPTSVFIAHSIVTYAAEKTQLAPANARRATRSLRLVCRSVDALDDYETTPVKPFHSSLQERSKLYQALPVEAESVQSFNSNVDVAQEDSDERFADFTQGAPDHQRVFNESIAATNWSFCRVCSTS